MEQSDFMNTFLEKNIIKGSLNFGWAGNIGYYDL